MHALALLDILPAPECPRAGGIRLPDFLAGVAAALLGCVRRSRGAVTVAAVRGIQMGCAVFRRVTRPT
jgi:hypothetical protein